VGERVYRGLSYEEEAWRKVLCGALLSRIRAPTCFLSQRSPINEVSEDVMLDVESVSPGEEISVFVAFFNGLPLGKGLGKP
jgi:hypothetical protein